MLARTLLLTLTVLAALAVFADAQTTSPASAPARPGPLPADQPAPQNTATFLPGHELLLKKAKQGGIDIYFEGDSITRRWQGTDDEHKPNWDANFYGWNAVSFGWGGDTTQNVIWRLEHDELDGVNPKIIVLMIGTNNVGNTVRFPDDDAFADDVARGIKKCLELCHEKAPNAIIILTAITPRNDRNGSAAVMPTVNKINDRIAKFADGKTIRYININGKMADKDGKLFDGLTRDGLHPVAKGYQIWADALKPIFTELLGPPAKTDHAPPATGVPGTSDVWPATGIATPDKRLPNAPPYPAVR